MAIAPTRLQGIRSKGQLADAIGVPLRLLTNRAFAASQSHLYAATQQRKRSGGERTIHAPHWPLANMQRKLLILLEEIYRPSSRAMGFIKGRGIRQNAAFHVGKRLILNVDIQDYFGLIHVGRIRRRLMAKPYELSNDIATTIAKLCTLNDFLPIGAPTSPILANIVTSSLDAQLLSFARQHGCFYTRYADDITFSTNRRSFPRAMVRRTEEAASGVEVGTELNDLFVRVGFALQPSKTRLMDRTMRKEVCGVTCNERLNVRRSHLREVRGAINAWRKYGREAAEVVWHEKYDWRSASLERSLRGKIEHIIHIRGQNDKSTDNIVRQYNSLEDRNFKNIFYDFSEQNPLDILRSVCIVQCGSDEHMRWTQGTGFVIASGSIITNHHVVSFVDDLQPEGSMIRKNFDEISIIFEGEFVEHRMIVIDFDASKDLAILGPDDPNWRKVFARRACQLNFQEPAAGSEISLIGYPSHTDGGSCKFVRGHITGTSMFDGHRFFNISQPIVKGNSGGPVIDSFGQVIGIATKGVDSEDIADIMSNGCIPIHSIDRIILNS